MNKNIKLKENKEQLENKITLLNNKIQKLGGAIGGYKKETNKLKKEIEDMKLENKKTTEEYKEKIKQYEETIIDLKSDRYLVKKIPSGRPPKSQTMKLKHEKGSEVARKFLSDYE